MRKQIFTSFANKLKKKLKELRIVYFLYYNVYKLVTDRRNRKHVKELLSLTAYKERKSRFKMFWHMVFMCFVTRALYVDYFKLSFYNKSFKKTNMLLTRGRYDLLYPLLSTNENRKIMNEKDLFLSVFKAYIKRDWLALNNELTIGQLTEFVLKNPTFIAKPRSLNQGQGIEFVEASRFLSIHEMLAYLKSKNLFVIEERVYNHEALSKFSRNALSIVRIVTLRLPEKVEIISAFLRFNIIVDIVDNFSPGAYECPIDLDEGVIIKGVCDGINYDQYYDTHPFGFNVIGIKIPFWEEMINMVKEAALTLDNVYFIPWDVAISPDGPLIIEGNNNPGYKFQLIHDQINAYKMMKRAYRFAKTKK